MSYQSNFSNTISYEDKIKYIRLSRTENIGPKTFINLLDLYENIDEAMNRVSDLASRAGKSISLFPKAEAEKEYNSLKNFGADMIFYREGLYPKLLLEIYDFPPLITVLGNSSLLTNDKLVAIVGSRNYSSNGYNFTKKISRELVEHDYVIVSGLAKGIDSAAHISAIETKIYSTIAVIAGGINYIYPPENEYLYKKITESGLVIAEMPFDTVPKSQNFPRRNRIISGLSQAVIIIEASLKSGSLITAKFAIEQNREVFAVPGFPLDPRYEGTNKLIKKGAHLLTNSSDVINQMDFLKKSAYNIFDEKKTELYQISKYVKYNDQEYDEARKIIPPLLNSSPISIEHLIEETQIPARIMLTIILELELAGKIERHYGNKISIIF